MSDKNKETRADITTEMRSKAKPTDLFNGDEVGEPLIRGTTVEDWADRIDAAAEREAKIRESGNVAAMLKALKEAWELLDNDDRQLIAYSDTGALMDIIKPALSKPARNCDIYETETERRAAFIEWYNRTWDLKGLDAIDFCDLKHNVEDILHDYIDWLFDIAESKTKEETDESN